MKIGHNLKVLLAAASLSIAAGVFTQSLAQETETPAVEAPTFSDEKLESFTVAFAEVNSVQQEYAQKLEAAGSEEEQQKLQEEATGKMVEAIDATDGISIDEYTQVLQAAQADPELAQRINGLLNQAQ